MEDTFIKVGPRHAWSKDHREVLRRRWEAGIVSGPAVLPKDWKVSGLYDLRDDEGRQVISLNGYLADMDFAGIKATFEDPNLAFDTVYAILFDKSFLT